MPTLGETFPTRPIHDALVEGVAVLGQEQHVSFIPYVRTVLPIDGFVFWLNATLLSAPQLALAGLPSAAPISVLGSLHYSSEGAQTVDESIVIRHVDFTATHLIEAFAEVAPTVIYVADWPTPWGAFKFTFSSRGSYYQEADIHHYVGDAIYPAFEAQLIDDISEFDQRQVVSNSLPIWLSMFSEPIFPSPLSDVLPAPVAQGFQIYPAYLIPDNLVPAYMAVEISRTEPLQAAPRLGLKMSHHQLVSEWVRLTLYGFRNDDALDVQDYVLNYCELSSDLGVMNMPIMHDEYRQQTELTALAQKKIMECQVSYYQTRARDIARQYITNCVPTFNPSTVS